MLPTPQLGAEQRSLLKRFKALGKQDRATLLAFAEFLAARAAAASADDPEGSHLAEPKAIERPAEETVVGAIRRLSDSYFMLDRQTLLHETAGLMSAHVLQGRPAPEVIDELEQVFDAHYRRLAAAD